MFAVKEKGAGFALAFQCLVIRGIGQLGAGCKRARQGNRPLRSEDRKTVSAGGRLFVLADAQDGTCPGPSSPFLESTDRLSSRASFLRVVLLLQGHGVLLLFLMVSRGCTLGLHFWLDIISAKI